MDIEVHSAAVTEKTKLITRDDVRHVHYNTLVSEYLSNI